MSTLDRISFRNRHSNQALDVDRVVGPNADRVKSADLDGSGVIEGEQELGALFDAIDSKDPGVLDLAGGDEAAAYRDVTVLLRQRSQVEGPLGSRFLRDVPEVSAILGTVPGACLEHYGNFGQFIPSAGTGSVQDALRELGYPLELGEGARFRGYFGDATRAVVTQFQTEQGVADLYGPGIVGPRTLEKLDQLLAARRNGTVAPPPPPAAGQPEWVRPRPAVWSKEPVPSGTAAKGSTGPLVEWIQSKLIDLGYLPESLRGNAGAGFGNFGNLTELMVSSFQAWNGLVPADGQADRRTLEALAGAPQRTRSGVARLEGGVSFEGLTEAQKITYLRRVFDLNNPTNAPFNTQPAGVNFIQIRGFIDDAAVQNVPDRYNDVVYALINGPDGQPQRLEVLTAGADYGDQMLELQKFGWNRPGDPALGPVVGQPSYLEKGLGLTAAGAVGVYAFGRHYSGASGVDRGLGLIYLSGKGHVDYNHNGQIDGAEWNHPVTNTGMNLHQGNSTDENIGPWSAGCRTFPTKVRSGEEGAYQRFVRVVLESGQVQAYIDQLVAQGMTREAARARVYGERRTDIANADGSGVFKGPVGGMTPVRFSVALVDSRALPDVASVL